MTILVTGCAGFIGSYVTRALLARGETVIGVDNLNDYYTPTLKRARLQQFEDDKAFQFHEIDIADYELLRERMKSTNITSIIHLAAQAGVRYSLTDPFAYSRSNLQGHLAILELARHLTVRHLVYASSSSVYGANEAVPFKETHACDNPVSLYGATKKSNELMSVSYARLYALPQTGLRFFTVYGPMGRPDMAYWIFTEKMLRGEPIEVFNHGKMGRDFTYIDDIVDGVLAAHDRPPASDGVPHRIYNLGNDRPEALMTLIELLEKELGLKAEKTLVGMQRGDVERTWADITLARRDLGFQPKITLAEGIARFVAWRRSLAAPFV
ncbi:NAD-dependent epimerase/dehydratase [hydrothermal vent metagenome]|uniref:NAD-dependent epimerase/dehydratase n=1 Tax=hydrothermal vent metagenome TaxID=652676 RepID=A0A3B0RP88_9ZZZZ